MKLTTQEERSYLSDLRGWEIIDTQTDQKAQMTHKESHKALRRLYTFKTFTYAFEFMTQAAEPINVQDHHPRWQNNYNRLEIWLSTHDANDEITDRDWKLARSLEDIWIATDEAQKKK